MRYFVFILLCLLAAGLSIPSAAQSSGVRVGQHADYARLVLEGALKYTLTQQGITVTMRFDAAPPFALPEVIPSVLQPYVLGYSQPDARTLVFTVKEGVAVRHFVSDGNAVVDFRAPQKPEKLEKPEKIAQAPSSPRIPVRVGQHPTYTRIVFDWPQKMAYTLSSTSPYTLTFAKEGTIDSAALQRRLPKGIEVSVISTAPLTLQIAATVERVRDFINDNSVVLDFYGVTTTNVASTPVPTPPPLPPSPVEQAKPLQSVSTTTLNPPATQRLAAQAVLGTNGVNLQFPWQGAVAAAVFERGGAVWIVFDQPAIIDTQALINQAGKSFISVEQLDEAAATILRLKLASPLAPTLWKRGNTWHIDLRPQAWSVESVPAIIPMPTASPPQLTVRMAGLSAPLSVIDPLIGDTLVIVPALGIGHGHEGLRRFPEFSLLPTAQGIVVEPYSDSIAVRSLRDGISIHSETGLSISDAPPSRATGIPTTLDRQARLYDYANWALVPRQRFFEKRQSLQEDITRATRQQRNVRRLEYAQFLFAHNYWQEAESVIRAMAAEDATLLDTIPVAALQGALQFLTNRPQEAINTLTRLDDFANFPERNLWLAASYGSLRQWDDAVDAFATASTIPASYPAMAAIPLTVAIAEALMAKGEWGRLDSLMDAVSILDLTPAQRLRLDYLRALQFLNTGKNTEARALLTRLADTSDPWARTRARYALVNDDLAGNRIKNAQAIEQLERLRLAWRGDHFEFTVMQRLTELYQLERDFRNALRLMQLTAQRFPDTDDSKAILAAQQQLFIDIYLGGLGDDLPPLTALALYDEFRLLTPNDARGDEMIRKLSDKLVTVDLLDRAATLLEHQVRRRLQGEERARIGARLALIRMLDRKAGEAIQALDFSEYTDIPQALALERKYLRTRALLMNGKPADALRLLDLDTSETANQLRLEIHWETKNYRQLAVTARQLVTARPRSKDVSPKQAQYILNLALALSMDGQFDALNTLKADYGDAMQKTPLAEAFALIARPPLDSDFTDVNALSKQFSEIQSFESFLNDYRTRLRENPLSGVN